MKYTIGYEYKVKEEYINTVKKERVTGIYGIGRFGFPVVLDTNTTHKDVDILIFDNPEDATLYAQGLSRNYRKDDCASTQKFVKKNDGKGGTRVVKGPTKSKYIRRFYPVKINSSKFPFKIYDEKESENKEIKQNRFGKKESTKRYYRYLTGTFVPKKYI